MRASRRVCLLVLFAAACSQEPYSLDPQTLAAPDGSLPDSDPFVLGDRDQPGHALAGDADGASGPLIGDPVPIAPQLAAVLGDTASDEAEGVTRVGEGLLFAGSTLALVKDSTASAQRAVVQLIVEWRDGERSLCSGTLVRPDAVLTAAHCVFDTRRQGFAYAITAGPGAQGGRYPEGRIAAKRAFAPSLYRAVAYESSARYAYDYAVVRLERSFAVSARSLAPGSAAFDQPFVVRGYPGVAGHAAYDGQHMYESRDRIRTILSDGIFHHRASTLGGMSGAGIDDGARIVGVHTGGTSARNNGVVFSPTSLANVRDWASRAL